jgi:hypothetical protein
MARNARPINTSNIKETPSGADRKQEIKADRKAREGVVGTNSMPHLPFGFQNGIGSAEIPFWKRWFGLDGQIAGRINLLKKDRLMG